MPSKRERERDELAADLRAQAAANPDPAEAEHQRNAAAFIQNGNDGFWQGNVRVALPPEGES